MYYKIIEMQDQEQEHKKMQNIKFKYTDDTLNMFPEFGNIKFYGTIDEPLFALTDVQTAIGVGQIRLEDYYEEDYVEIRTLSRDGKNKKKKMLTESGLYTAISRSKTDVGRKFRRFVAIVLRQLRLTGQAELNNVLERLKISEQQSAMLDKQLCKEHKLLVEQTEMATKYYNRTVDQWCKIAKLQQESAAPSSYSHENLCQALQERYMKKYYMYKVRPPRHLAVTWDPDDDPADDEDFCFELRSVIPEVCSCAEVYIHKNLNKLQLREHLHSRNFAIYADGVANQNIYFGSIANLKSAVLELI